jgi:hypothetical protein
MNHIARTETGNKLLALSKDLVTTELLHLLHQIRYVLIRLRIIHISTSVGLFLISRRNITHGLMRVKIGHHRNFAGQTI